MPRPGQRKRGNHMASIKQTGENSYQITVSCGYDSTGKKIRKKTTFKPELFTDKGNRKSDRTIEKEVAAFAAEFERKVLTGQYTAGYTLTFEKYSQKYLEEYAAELQAPRTLQSTQAAIREFIPAFEYMPLENMTPLFLQEYINSLTKRKKANGQPLAHGTVKRKAAVLSAMLSQAVRWNLMSSNPMDRVQVKTPSTPPEEKIMFFSREQAEAFLGALDNVAYYFPPGSKKPQENGADARILDCWTHKQSLMQYKFFLYLAVFTGSRRGELIALTWEDLDIKARTVRINKSVCRVNGQNIVKVAKTRGSVRVISLPAVVISLAREWKAEQARYRLQIGSKWEGNGHIFIRWNGACMGLETPYKIFRRVIQNYNIDHPANPLPLIPLHGLRHTAATILIGSGVDLSTVSGRLGHSCASTTLNIYSHAIEELDWKAADVLADVLTKKA